jgi:hypothetical protein
MTLPLDPRLVRRGDTLRPQHELTRCAGCDKFAWRMHGVPVSTLCSDCAKRVAAEDDYWMTRLS